MWLIKHIGGESFFRLMLIGALNATLEWFDPAKGSAEELADDYADAFLYGILNQTGDSS